VVVVLLFINNVADAKGERGDLVEVYKLFKGYDKYTSERTRIGNL